MITTTTNIHMCNIVVFVCCNNTCCCCYYLFALWQRWAQNFLFSLLFRAVLFSRRITSPQHTYTVPNPIYVCTSQLSLRISMSQFHKIGKQRNPDRNTWHSFTVEMCLSRISFVHSFYIISIYGFYITRRLTSFNILSCCVPTAELSSYQRLCAKMQIALNRTGRFTGSQLRELPAKKSITKYIQKIY